MFSWSVKTLSLNSPLDVVRSMYNKSPFLVVDYISIHQSFIALGFGTGGRRRRLCFGTLRFLKFLPGTIFFSYEDDFISYVTFWQNKCHVWVVKFSSIQFNKILNFCHVASRLALCQLHNKQHHRYKVLPSPVLLSSPTHNNGIKF